MKWLWEKWKQLWKESNEFYQAISKCALKRKCKEICLGDQKYELNRNQKKRINLIMIVYWILFGAVPLIDIITFDRISLSYFHIFAVGVPLLVVEVVILEYYLVLVKRYTKQNLLA